ncbi:hypothetical protein K438DRAFT_1975382 [Mycena galopus ATCC 62051]|nr:hypothetical protein K438DRAFT_1975382 [Mycena galopus ATCC 62051]
MQNPASELLPSLLLAVVAAIPNHTLRYTAIGSLLALAILCSIHLRSLSMQMCQLAVLVDQIEECIRRAIVQNPRSYLTLTEQMGHLLESAAMASSIKCRILNSGTAGEWFGWNKYWSLSSDIGECTKGVKTIRTAVQLILEAERQRKLTDDIQEIQFILTSSNAGFRCVSVSRPRVKLAPAQHRCLRPFLKALCPAGMSLQSMGSDTLEADVLDSRLSALSLQPIGRDELLGSGLAAMYDVNTEDVAPSSKKAWTAPPMSMPAHTHKAQPCISS